MTNPQRRAIKIWPVMVEVAAKGETVTYTQLVARAGLCVLPRSLRPYLDRLQEFCLEHGQPNLPTIVVRRDTGRPGRELPYPYGGTWAKELAAVSRTKWDAVGPPTADDLRP
jgi:hypothetical protein